MHRGDASLVSKNDEYSKENESDCLLG